MYGDGVFIGKTDREILEHLGLKPDHGIWTDFWCESEVDMLAVIKYGITYKEMTYDCQKDEKKFLLGILEHSIEFEEV
jgi:hypothetical protein